MQTDTRIIRLATSLTPLAVTAEAWLAFAAGRLPLPPTERAPGRQHRLRIVTVQTLRHGSPGQHYVQMDGSVFDVDPHGYLLPPENAPQVRVAGVNVVDAQYRFYVRRARHRHGWQPPPAVCQAVLELLSVRPGGPAGGFPYD